MTHQREFSPEDHAARTAHQARRQAEAERTAAAYARVFATDDGRHVLADLRAKFGHHRPRFHPRDRTLSTVTAALIDGECNVLREIETAARTGGLVLEGGG